MGDATSGPVRLSFNPQLRVEFRGATVTSDAGLLLPRELDERLGLSALIERHLSDPLPEPRTALGALPVGAPTKHPEDLIVRAPGAGTAILWRSCHLPATEGAVQLTLTSCAIPCGSAASTASARSGRRFCEGIRR